MALTVKLFVVLLVITLGRASPYRRSSNCDIICTADYKPVCGTNGFMKRTFSNECQMSVASCQEGIQYTKVHDGVCGRGRSGEWWRRVN